MSSREEKERALPSYPRDDLESPFLEGELFPVEPEAEWEAHLAALEAESHFQSAFQQAGELIGVEKLEEEFVEEERVAAEYFQLEEAEAYDEEVLADWKEGQKEVYYEDEVQYAEGETDDEKALTRMKFEIQTTNRIWRNDGKTASLLERKYGPNDFLVDKKGVRLESETGGVLEFETEWFRTWPKLEKAIEKAVKMTDDMNRAASSKYEKTRKSFPFNVDNLRKGSKKEISQGFWERKAGMEGEKEKILRAAEVLEVEIIDSTWKAGIQSSESFLLEYYESFMKQHEWPFFRDGTIKHAKAILASANTGGLSATEVGKLRSFLQIIVNYILRGQGGKESENAGAFANVDRLPPKQAFTLMSRTNFASMYKVLLTDKEKRLFEKIVKNDSVLKEMGLNRKSPLFIKGYGTKRHEPGPTVHQWLAVIVRGVDLLSVQSGKGLSAAMGRYNVETRKGKKDRWLVKFETRNTTIGATGIEAKDWVKYASKLFEQASKRESDAVNLVHQQGISDENKLTNFVFYAHHPELGGRRIRKDERALAQEWLQIRNVLVRPSLQGVQPELEEFEGTGEERERTDVFRDDFTFEEPGIIGIDNRVRVRSTTAVPWRWVCKIVIEDSRRRLVGLGTGTLVSDRHVLTAAHVVYDAYKNMHQYTITVIPALNDLKEPFDRYTITSKPKMRKEYSSTAANGIDWDYALLTLNTVIGKKSFSALKGSPLCYWGNPHCGANTVFARLDPRNLNAKAAYTAGYPGGKGGKQLWCAAGILHSANERHRTMWITADTTGGQSGSPVWVTDNGRYCLVGVAVGAGTRSNKVVRLTREMIRQLRAWITEDGETPSMIVTEAALESPALALSDSETEHFEPPAAEWAPEPATGEAEYFTGVDFEEDELEPLDEQPLEELFNPAAVPKDVADALAKPDWPLALKLAIQAGWRDENNLTNLIFFARHRELPVERLDPKDPRYKQLSAEWTKILNEEVWQAIQESAENIDLVVSGKEVTDHHRRFFRGKSGRRLKKLVEDAAREVDLNPGLLGTIMMAETRRPQSYISSEKVSSYHIGVDDFYEGSSAIKDRVPAYAKIKWDKNQTPIVHDNDSLYCKKKAAAIAASDKAATEKYSKLCRQVKTILFDSGPDAVLATAVYVKFREVRLREIAAELGGDFDHLSLPTRLALTRIAMGAGTLGATQILNDALKGVDIFVRKAISVKIYQTRRNATVRTAQAMHLSDWIFGIPVPAAVAQPGLKTFEDIDEPESADDEFENGIEASYEGMDTELGETVEHPHYRREEKYGLLHEECPRCGYRFTTNEVTERIEREYDEEEQQVPKQAQKDFEQRLKAVAESQTGVPLNYSWYPVTQKDPKTGTIRRDNKWRQSNKRSEFGRSGEAAGSFCLGAARSMAFRTLFGLDRPSYRQVLTDLKKEIEAAHDSNDVDTEAKLIIQRIVLHSHSSGSMEQFNQDIGQRYGIKNVNIRNASRTQAMNALKQGAPIIADLGKSGWHWVLVHQSPRGGLWANDPLDGPEVYDMKVKRGKVSNPADFELGSRFELIVDATTDVTITPDKAKDYKLTNWTEPH